MQNAECKMQNCGVPSGDDHEIMREAHTIILHSAFCILHSRLSQNALHIVQSLTLAFHKTGCSYGSVGQHGTGAGFVL